MIYNREQRINQYRILLRAYKDEESFKEEQMKYSYKLWNLIRGLK